MTEPRVKRAGTQLVGPALTLGLARALAQLGLAVAVVLIARELGVDGLGRYAFYTASGSVGVGSVAAGFAVLATREAGRDGTWTWSTVLRFVPFAVPGALCVVALAFLVQGGHALVPAALAIVGYGLSGALAVASGATCGAGYYSRAAAAESLAGITMPLFTFGALELNTGVPGALAGLAIGGAAGLLVLTPRRPRRANAPQLSGRAVLPFVLIGLASAGYARLDALAVRLATGESMLGVYSAAYRLLGPVLIIVGAFGSVFFARLSSGSLSADRRSLSRASVLLAAMVLPVAALEAAFAPALIQALYGPGFGAAVGPARILLLSSIPLCLYWPLAHAMNARGLELRWAAVVGTAAVGGAVAAAWAVSVFGASGAAVVWLGTESAVAAVLVSSKGVVCRDQVHP